MLNSIYNDLLKKVDDGNQCAVLTFLGSGSNCNNFIKKKLILTKDDIESREISLDEKIYDGVDSAISLKEIHMVNLENNETVLIEPYFPKPRLIIYGGGHIAKPLCEFANRVGFLVTVIDDRPYFANTARFPEAREVICEDFEKSFDKISFRESDFVVIVTRGHRHDELVLKNVINHNLKYIGMIGSKRRVKGLKEDLVSQGFSKESLENICSPIGMDIFAVTPDEIAISIVGELISFKNRRIVNNKALKSSYNDFDKDVISMINNKDSIPKAVLTILSSKGSVPRKAGAKMIAYLDGRTIGSIGGGCSEAQVLNKARSMMSNLSSYSIEDVDMTGEVSESIGMVCGGTMKVLIEVY